MNITQAAVLGVVQGLAEFLPISSSGHLELAQYLLGVNAGDAAIMLLTVLLHVGTLFAVFVYFWKEWMHMLRHLFVSRTFRMLFLASMPALVVAILLKVFVGGTDALFGSGFLGVAFLITGVFLIITESIKDRGRHASGRHHVTTKNALAMGTMQAIALMPGVSRSGSTLLGGIASGLSRSTAAQFSFMMSAPAILGSLILEGKHAMDSGAFAFLSANLVPVVVGVALAAICGYLAIKFMMKLINKLSLYWFAAYVLLIGAIVIYMQVTGAFGMPPLSQMFGSI